ncbi:hypothetical protein SAMN04487859_11055 [Roseovarius lutimaris]|uniref:Alpha/beta hydrolase n=1 Tax=Roseovarius lutimaris TaxID=1005928 RepID=A0A1I5CHW1_9RHOB|nr:hypothetical protein [Roseovarius lutimaris]SFN86578.1 hypothetical protein SAMN04487859_11055 [Roseovarius lutimaris]
MSRSRRFTFALIASLLASTPGLASHDEGDAICGSNGPVVPRASHIPTMVDVENSGKPFETKALNAAPEGAHIFNWLAHGVFQDRPRDQLEEGYVISLEKLYAGDRLSGPQHQRDILYRYGDMPDGPPEDVSAQRDFWLTGMFSDPKLQVVTHITRYENRRACGLMNAYQAASAMPTCDTGIVPDTRSFKSGVDALFEVFLRDLAARLKQGNFTHIVFASMGWNNDQRVSICRYRQIMQMTGHAMTGRGEAFRPLVIGMTWSSSWNAASTSKLGHAAGHIGSVLNKATDSDEAGVLHGNLILNRIIPAANTGALPVVVLGHSMGARFAGRALFSRDLLKQGAVGPAADLAVFLQPAHSAYRYGGDTFGARGNEGHPYDSYKDLPDAQVVVTTSLCDFANPFALWSPYLGGRRGWKVASRAAFDEIFYRLDWRGSEPCKTGRPALKHSIRNDPASMAPLDTLPRGKVTLVNAGFVTSHSDILDPAMGAFLARLISRYAAQ